MPAIELPRKPGIKSARPRLIDYGADQEPALAGPFNRLNRPGNRYAIDIELPPMRSEPTGRIYTSRLRRAKREGALFAFPQDGFKVGSPGTPVVNLGGQSGRTLNIRGLTPYYSFREGQFFSLVHSGRRYLSAVAAPVLASGTGTAAVELEEMLRVIPSDGDTCEIARPMIEGVLAGQTVEWELMTDPYTVVRLTITESA